MPPAWSRSTFRQRSDELRDRRDANASWSSSTRSRTTTIRTSVSPASRCSKPPGCPRRSRRTSAADVRLISQGLLAEARAAAGRTPTRCTRWRAAGARFVFFEPSCLSAVREDAPALLRGERRQRAAAVAAQSLLFEDLLEQHLDGAASPMPFAAAAAGSCFTGIAIRKPWDCCRLRKRSCRESRTRRWTISTPGAAAWLARSATPRNTSTSLGQSASAGCCRRRGGSRPTTCWSPAACPAATRSRTSRMARALHPAELLASLLEEPA